MKETKENAQPINFSAETGRGEKLELTMIPSTKEEITRYKVIYARAYDDPDSFGKACLAMVVIYGRPDDGLDGLNRRAWVAEEFLRGRYPRSFINGAEVKGMFVSKGTDEVYGPTERTEIFIAR